MKMNNLLYAKSTNKDLVNLVATVLEVTLKDDFGFDEYRTGKFRSQFIKNMGRIIALMVKGQVRIKQYD